MCGTTAKLPTFEANVYHAEVANLVFQLLGVLGIPHAQGARGGLEGSFLCAKQDGIGIGEIVWAYRMRKLALAVREYELDETIGSWSWTKVLA